MDHDATLIPTEPVPPAPPTTLHKIFFGEDGLRAGWSLLIFVAIFAAIVFSVNFIGHRLFPGALKTPKPGAEASPTFLYFAELIPFVITVLVTWIMSKIERRPNSVYGFGGRRRLKYFFSGLAWGIVCLSLLIVALWKAGLLVVDNRLLFGSDIFRYGAIWLLGFFLVGLLEEYLTRGYLQYTLTRGLAGIYQWAFKTRHSKALGFWTAAIIFSLLFGLGHGKNPGSRRSDCCRLGWRPCFSVLVYGVPARSGGRSASTPRGIGASLFSMASPTADLWCSTIFSPRTPSADPF